MKTKLLLTISLICLLVASTQAAIPYEYFPNRSEADGETPGAKIPNCIQQRGYQCYACGPDTSKTPAVPLFPNALNQCVPNPTGSGCNRFLDIQGNTCDISYGCNCKFVLDAIGSTCITSTIPNCFILANDGTCAQCIGLNRVASYKNQFLANQNVNQKTPVGGGISDYGRSFDGKTCVDNLANGNPNCLEYLDATSCIQCDPNFVLVQTGTPTSSLKKCVRIAGFSSQTNCLVYTPNGQNCFTCNANYALNISGGCNAISDNNFLPGASNVSSDNCLRYAKGPDGKDNTSICLKCVKWSFQLQDRRCSQILNNPDQQINYITGAIADNQGSDCRLFYIAQFADQTNSNSNTNYKFCLVKKAANDYYISQPTTPAPVSTDNTRTELGCQNFDSASGKCLLCLTGFYLNTLNGSCNDNSLCPIAGCKTANGYNYCTECYRGYNLVDGYCFMYSLVDQTTTDHCKTVTNGECTECDPEYFLDLQDTLSNPSTKRNQCRLLETNSDCSGWKAGKCVECSEQAKTLVAGQCVWTPDSTFGGVPGCAIHQSDGKCTTAYPYAFLSKDKTFTRIIKNECASYDEDGNCTSVNNINYYLNFDYPTGLFVVAFKASSYCEKSYDTGCTCVSCKPTFTLSATKTCPPNYDSVPAVIIPNNVIRGCVKFATTTTCEKCRTPDFITTADGQCYDLKFIRKPTSAATWKNLFIQINQNSKDGSAANQSTTSVYNPNYYEACTEATTIYACKTCSSGRPTNILVTIASADASYFASDITYCHDNTDTNFKSLVATKSVLVNDNLTAARTTDANQLDRVAGCLAYTSLVLGTCATCGTGLTKSADSTICYMNNGADGDGIGSKNCGTVDASTGKCLTCPDTQSYIYDSTNKLCLLKSSNTYRNCLTQDLTTLKCLTCNPSHVFDTDNTVCLSVLSTSIYGCNTNVCYIGTATYVPKVTTPTVVNGYLQAASCGKGYTYDSTNKNCLTNKSDWTTAAEVDAQTGIFLTCSSGYTLYNYNCIPSITNCKTYDFNNNLSTCTACASDANGMPYIPVNQVNGSGKYSLCIAPQNQLDNCDIYNLSGTGCVKCSSVAQNLEAQGCRLPPNCQQINPNTLKCATCYNGKLTPQGDCIELIPGYWADSGDCAQAFNATHCAECTNSKIIAIDDSNNDNLYGVGECVDPSVGCALPTGCELTLRNKNLLDCSLTTYQCIRCSQGYSMFGGQCYDNTNSDQRFPYECVNVEFDEVRKDYVCTECDFGFAITADRRQCIPNYGPCSYLDSTDCANYEQPVGHEEVQIACVDERSTSSSMIISVSIMIILNIIFFTI